MKFWYKMRVIVTFILAVVMLGLPFLSIKYDVSIKIVQTSLFSIIVILVIIYMEKISEIGFGKLYLKLREKISEAEKITTALKGLTKVWAEITINSLITRESVDFWVSSESLPEAELSASKIIEDIKQTLKKVGFSDYEISTILKPWETFRINNNNPSS